MQACKSLRCFCWSLALVGAMLAGAPAISTAGGAQDLLGTAASSGTFNTFLKAVQAAGLDDVLKGKGPLTVLAPTDEAFAKLPQGVLDNLLKPENKEQLKKVLTYHVLPGSVMERHMIHMDWARTVNGKKLDVGTRKGDIIVDKHAKVVKADLGCSNGVLYAIDAVMMP